MVRKMFLAVFGTCAIVLCGTYGCASTGLLNSDRQQLVALHQEVLDLAGEFQSLGPLQISLMDEKERIFDADDVLNKELVGHLEEVKMHKQKRSELELAMRNHTATCGGTMPTQNNSSDNCFEHAEGLRALTKQLEEERKVLKKAGEVLITRLTHLETAAEKWLLGARPFNQQHGRLLARRDALVSHGRNVLKGLRLGVSCPDIFDIESMDRCILRVLNDSQ